MTSGAEPDQDSRARRRLERAQERLQERFERVQEHLQERLAQPLLRGWFHQVAFLVSIPAGIVISIVASGAKARAGAIVYALGLFAMYGGSTVYHRYTRTRATRLIWRHVDHSTIFVLIAATYTPIALLLLPTLWATLVLVVVWGAAVAGITLNFFSMERRGVQVAKSILFIGIGWTAVLIAPVLVMEMTPVELALAASGGVIYTLGSIVLLKNKPDPWPNVFGYHEVWHAMVVVASGLHYAMVFMLVTGR